MGKWGVMVGGVGSGWEVLGCPGVVVMVVGVFDVVCFFVLWLHSGRIGSSGHGSSLAGARGPTTATLWLSVSLWRSSSAHKKLP